MPEPHSGAMVPDVWGLVPPRNKNFTGREESLRRLREGLAGQVTAAVPHALHGLGGVGKTQIAVEYAYRYRSGYQVVWWVPADQPVLVRSALAGLALHVGLPPETASGIEDAANGVLDALRRGDPYDKWLLIFDNADQPEDLHHTLPTGGHILITSRNHRWEGVVDTVAVDVFSRTESVEFLNKRVRKGMGEQDADRLADELGDLPLALEQAGALQAETGMGVPEYLRLLSERTSQLLSEGKPTEYPASMTASWSLSVVSLNERLPEAVQLLRRCSFFGPEPIPRDIFRPDPRLETEFAALVADPIRLSRAFGELARYALARLDIPARTIRVHRLIQALVRDEIPAEEQGRLRHEVHLLLAGYAPDDPFEPANWPRFAILLDHILSSKVGECTAEESRHLCLDVVRYLAVVDDLPTARGLADRFLANWIQQSGEEHPDVLQLRLENANILRDLGEYQTSAELNSATLQMADEVLGPDDWRTLALLRGECADLRARGEFKRAQERDRQLLQRYEARFGRASQETILVVNSLAVDAILNSEYLSAKELLQDAYQKLLALESPSRRVLLTTWSGLARAVRLCGDYPEACDLGEDAYAFGLEEFGPEYNWTLRTAKDLSIASRRAGDMERAVELAELVHRTTVRRHGIDHPDTLAAATCLANLKRTCGGLDEAMDLAADTVRRYPLIYGATHPYSCGCIGNLAVIHRALGDPHAARNLNEEALLGLESKLGRDHHYSLTVATNLASDLAMVGDYENACRLGRGTLRRLRNVLGETHPVSLCCAANLTTDLRALGETEEAATLSEQTKAAYTHTVGLDHPDAMAFLDGRRLDADFDPPPI